MVRYADADKTSSNTPALIKFPNFSKSCRTHNSLITIDNEESGNETTVAERERLVIRVFASRLPGFCDVDYYVNCKV